MFKQYIAIGLGWVMRGAIYSGEPLQNARFDFEGKKLGPKFNWAPNRYQKWILHVEMG